MNQITADSGKTEVIFANFLAFLYAKKTYKSRFYNRSNHIGSPTLNKAQGNFISRESYGT